MSIDLNWETLTGGPEGEALAASIRDFVHTKFQAVPLPRFIKSVAVHDFEFGQVAPQIVLKDICDPLPDFYEEDPDIDYGDDEDTQDDEAAPSEDAGSHRSRSYNGFSDEDEGGDEHMSASIETLGASSNRTGATTMPPTPATKQDRHQHHHGGARDVPDAIKAAERRRHAELDRRRYGAAAARGGGGGHQHHPSTDSSSTANPFLRQELRRFNSDRGEFPFPSHHLHLAGAGLRSGTPDLGTPFLGLGASTPGIAGGMSNMHYFQSKLGPGWSGTQTPLAAVAGAQHLGGWLDAANNKRHNSPAQADARRRAALGASAVAAAAAAAGGVSSRSGSAVGAGFDDGLHEPGHHRTISQSSISITDFPAPLAPPLLREKHSVSTLGATSAGHSRPPTRDRAPGGPGPSGLASEPNYGYSESPSGPSAGVQKDNSQTPGAHGKEDDNDSDNESQRKFREPRVDDMQAVFRIKYSGDVRLRLTAEILLDYPMPSFVGIPLKLNISGLTFDGVGVLANIRKRVHFCFLSPDDALAAIGADDDDDDNDNGERSNENGGGNNNETGGGGDGHHPRHNQQHEGVSASHAGDQQSQQQPVALATTAGVGLHHTAPEQPSRLMESLTLDPTSPPRRRGTVTSGGVHPHHHQQSLQPQQQQQQQQRGKLGGLLQEIRVESEIGQREGTKQSLKNVSKVERFVLEQVRRIFEEELVYPSFWTFLV
ncbi:mitochondrial distribution and morphology protein 12 [Microdochium nivale]|nr:mitochondrial distribution and morphology protein 12 [Microdochium nivale]